MTRGADSPGARSPEPGARCLVMGYHTMGCVGFDALLRHGFDVAAVFTHRDDPHEEIWWESLGERATKKQIPVHYPENLKEASVFELAHSYAPDFIFSFYFRFMIPVPILGLAPRGALNLHGSLLPRYRGRAPVNWVLVNGETETGVSLHYMVAKPDAGDLVDQERVEIADDDTALTLFHKLETAAELVLDRSLPLLREGRAQSRPMDLAAGSYFGGRKPSDGQVDWSWSARRVYNLIRAVTHPYPGAFTYYDTRKLFLWWGVARDDAARAPEGTVVSVSPAGIEVATGAGVLRITRCQLEDEPEADAVVFAAAHGISPGTVLGHLGETQ